jgi:endonuclease YncB( thermonuclease family)
VTFNRRYARPRPFYKSVFDAVVFIAALGMIVLALGQAGLLSPETGNFIAIDGDSLRQGDRNYRLHGIDAPELHQSCFNRMGGDYPCGQESKRTLASLVRGQTLSCAISDTDRYGRGVAQCRAGDLDINAEMVRRGWAIAYLRHGTAYADEEVLARNAKRGLWQGDFENPEDWRSRHRTGPLRSGMPGDGFILD